MAKDENRISIDLGKNIEQLRKKRGLSQAQLAKLADLPRSTLTYIESGAGNPSLKNLVKMSSALQVSVEELLSKPQARVKLLRGADTPFQTRAAGQAIVYKLLPDPIPGAELDRLEMKPGARIGGVPHTQHTKEYLICCKGKIELNLNKEKFLLEEGDVVAFPGDQPHSYFNPGSQKNLCISVVMFSAKEYG